MPEARDRVAGPAGADDLEVELGISRGVAPAGVGDLAVGFGINRGLDRRLRIGRGGQSLQQRSLSDNKENIPPESSRSARRRTRPRKSPLPSWYPRSPLHDITAVVRALERRRSRLRVAAELRRRQQSANNSPVPFPSTPPRQELQNSEHLSPRLNEDSDPLLNVSDPSASPGPMKSTLQPIEGPPESPPPSDGLVRNERTLTAAEKKCEELIDEFKKVVTENLKRMEKATPRKKTETRTLMSMR